MWWMTQVNGVDAKFEVARRRGLKLLLPRKNYDKLMRRPDLTLLEKETMLIPLDDVLDVLHHGLEGEFVGSK